MRISKDEMIEGIPAVSARELMRAFYHKAGAWRAANTLGVPESEARDVLARFASSGYLDVEAGYSGEQEWNTTVHGNALAQASFGKPITRATADRHLKGVIERARAYNTAPDKLLAVAEIVVFGSYLDNSRDRLGDLDLSIKIVRRFPVEEWTERLLEYTARSERTFNSFVDELFWPRRELIMCLRNRCSAISITKEDVSQLTDRYRLIYEIKADSSALQPPPNAAVDQ